MSLFQQVPILTQDYHRRRNIYSTQQICNQLQLQHRIPTLWKNGQGPRINYSEESHLQQIRKLTTCRHHHICMRRKGDWDVFQQHHQIMTHHVARGVIVQRLTTITTISAFLWTIMQKWENLCLFFSIPLHIVLLSTGKKRNIFTGASLTNTGNIIRTLKLLNATKFDSTMVT